MPDEPHVVNNNFDEFPPVSQAQWWQKVTEGKPPEVMSTRPEQAVVFSAVNTHEHLPALATTRSVIEKAPCTLEVRIDQRITSAELQSLVQSGVTGLRVTHEHIIHVMELLPELNHPLSRVSLEVDDPDADLPAAYVNYFRELPTPAGPVQGTVYWPSTPLAHWQKGKVTVDPLAELFAKTTDVPFHLLAIPGDAFHAWGASVTDELAMTLSWWVAYGDLLTDRGIPVASLFSRTEITLATGADFFLDLAKFRSLRALMNKVGEAYGLGNDERAEPSVRAVSGTTNKTLYDPDSNILRNTTEALAALLGGANTLSLLPHDFLYPTSGTFANRLATNVYNILQHEAHIEKVHDPAAGSYFLEDITGQLVEKSWELFLTFEEQGGFSALLQAGTLEARCRQQAAKQARQVATHRKVIVGATRYVNQQELSFKHNDTIPRLATSFERIRNELDVRVAQRQARPVLQLWIQQDGSSVVLINQRANYVRDVLTGVGIAYEAHTIRRPEDFSFSVATDAHQLGCIFCGTDTFYESTVATILKTQRPAESCRWIAGGGKATVEVIRQAGGNGVLGIGHDVISLIEQTIKRWIHET